MGHVPEQQSCLKRKQIQRVSNIVWNIVKLFHRILVHILHRTFLSDFSRCLEGWKWLNLFFFCFFNPSIIFPFGMMKMLLLIGLFALLMMDAATSYSIRMSDKSLMKVSACLPACPHDNVCVPYTNPHCCLNYPKIWHTYTSEPWESLFTLFNHQKVTICWLFVGRMEGKAKVEGGCWRCCTRNVITSPGNVRFTS